MKGGRDQAKRRVFRLRLKGREFVLGAGSYFCGIINRTPDSFSRDGVLKDKPALQRVEAMVAAGADLLDIGGESSRPGACPVSAKEEARRVVPFVRKIARHFDIPLSIDTTKRSVAESAFAAGASCLNDISALQGDPTMPDFVEREKPPVILMHRQGEPSTMQEAPHYRDVVAEVARFLQERKTFCLSLGLPEEKIWLDPGIGFGKSLPHNLFLLQNLSHFVRLGPVFLGVSRKRFLGQLTGKKVLERDFVSSAVGSFALACGVSFLRVHQVEAIADLKRVLEPLLSPKGEIYYLSLGSNLGDRLESLRRARKLMEERGIYALDISPVYETEPEGFSTEHKFFNQVLKVWTLQMPEELLEELKKIERELGRDREANGDRPIDCDIVLWKRGPYSDKKLTLPHPRAAGRGFVLYPLSQIDPYLLRRIGWRVRRKGILREVWRP